MIRGYFICFVCGVEGEVGEGGRGEKKHRLTADGAGRRRSADETHQQKKKRKKRSTHPSLRTMESRNPYRVRGIY